MTVSVRGVYLPSPCTGLGYRPLIGQGTLECILSIPSVAGSLAVHFSFAQRLVHLVEIASWDEVLFVTGEAYS